MRPLEREIVKRMLACKELIAIGEVQLASALVVDMEDDGMGSIRFLSPSYSDRHFGKAIAQAEYVDDDGVLVSIVINVDQGNEIYEVNFWRADFSPLKRYPNCSDLRIVTI